MSEVYTPKLVYERYSCLVGWFGLKKSHCILKIKINVCGFFSGYWQHHFWMFQLQCSAKSGFCVCSHRTQQNWTEIGSWAFRKKLSSNHYTRATGADWTNENTPSEKGWKSQNINTDEDTTNCAVWNSSINMHEIERNKLFRFANC